MSNTLIKDFLQTVVPGGLDTSSGPLNPGSAGQVDQVVFYPYFVNASFGDAPGPGGSANGLTLTGGVVTTFDYAAFNQIYRAGPNGWNSFAEQPAYFRSSGIQAPVNVLFTAYPGAAGAIRAHYLFVPTTPPVFSRLPDVVTFDPNLGWNAGGSSVTQVAVGVSLNTYYDFVLPDTDIGAMCGAGPALPDSSTGLFTVLRGFQNARGVLSIVDPYIVLSGISHSAGAALRVVVGNTTIHYLVAGVQVATSPADNTPLVQMVALLYAAEDQIDSPVITPAHLGEFAFQPLTGGGGVTATHLNGGQPTFLPMTLSAHGGYAHLSFLPLTGVGADFAFAESSNSNAFSPLSISAHGVVGTPAKANSGVLAFLPMIVSGTAPILFGSTGSNLSFRPLDMLGGKAITQTSQSMEFMPLAATGFGETDSNTEGRMMSFMVPVDSGSGALVVSVVISENLDFAVMLTTDNIVDASALSALFLTTPTTLQTLLDGIATSVIDIGAVTPTFEDPGNTWVLNDDSGAISTYVDYAFNSYAQIGSDYYGMQDDGLYLLNGDDDHGLPILASMSFGKLNFGTTVKKRVTDVYVGLASDGLLMLRVTIGEKQYLYKQKNVSTDHKIQRFVPGKKLEGSFIAFELYTDDNNDFEISSIEFTAIPLTRRI